MDCNVVVTGQYVAALCQSGAALHRAAMQATSRCASLNGGRRSHLSASSTAANEIRRTLNFPRFALQRAPGVGFVTRERAEQL